MKTIEKHIKDIETAIHDLQCGKEITDKIYYLLHDEKIIENFKSTFQNVDGVLINPLITIDDKEKILLDEERKRDLLIYEKNIILKLQDLIIAKTE